ncbi:MAG: aminomethyl-transferring glycine dehydrogenase subunit GcvPA [Bdellovibrionales bacterium]|nr:aminomethyl-transferring glycine dehydrogenase subunit GcvPA [Bdellovibrionales bacterium]
MRYIPLSPLDRQEMLESIGVSQTSDLFSSIPQDCLFEGKPDLPKAKNEQQLKDFFSSLAQKNRFDPNASWKSYLGAGCYSHMIPTVVDALSSRGEFATAYTPYQAEISQGTLQAIFEFQSMTASLYGMELSNASMYDGASSLAEAVLMACRIQKKNVVYLSQAIHPEYVEVARSYTRDIGIEIRILPLNESGTTDVSSVTAEDAAAVVLAQPNFFGVLENLEVLSKNACASLLSIVVNTEPLAFGLLKAPGEFGVDIVVGEGQSLGNPQHFGGPHLGLLCAKKKYLRQLPGRLVGRTVDQDGKEGFVLTLSTREQHIRRDKATSNICTNHSLIALRSAIYMACMGRNGMVALAKKNFERAHSLAQKLCQIKGVKKVFDGEFFHEFALTIPKEAKAFLSIMEEKKIVAGLDLSRLDSSRNNQILIAVTETKSDEDLDQYLKAFSEALA